jgi:hypothetical protein
MILRRVDPLIVDVIPLLNIEGKEVFVLRHAFFQTDKIYIGMIR